MIIACDTSSTICSVAVTHDGLVRLENSAQGGQIHIEKLTPFLKDSLDYSKSTGIPIDALAIAIGPGSFNGLRIGLATMKALAVSLDLPLIPIPTTDAMAYSLASNYTGLGRAVIFSHRNFVHFADYQFSGSHAIKTPEFHYSTWNDLDNDKIDYYFGKADRGFEAWLDGKEASSIKKKFINVDATATSVALIAESRLDQGITDLDELEPLYNVSYEAKKWVAPQF